MRLDILKTIYFKEMLDQLRDRRALISMVVFPIVVMPMLMIGMGGVMSVIGKKAEDESKTLGIGLKVQTPEIRAAIEKAGLKIVDKPDLRLAVEQKELAAAVEETEGANGIPQIIYYIDRSNLTSEAAGDSLRAILGDFKDAQVKQRLKAQNIPDSILTPFSIKRVNVAPERKMAGAVWGTILGYMLLLFMFLGGLHPAIDMTAGEKERKTLELYLSSPAERSEIVLGKIMATMTAIFMTAMLNLASITISIRGGRGFMGNKDPQMAAMLKTIPLDGHAIGIIVLTLLPLAVFAASIMIAIAILARSFKEGNTYLAPLALLVIFPALIGGMPGIGFTPAMALIPIFNASQVIRSTLLGDLTPTNFFITMGANLVYATAAFWFASRRFEDETVLFRT